MLENAATDRKILRAARFSSWLVEVATVSALWLQGVRAKVDVTTPW